MNEAEENWKISYKDIQAIKQDNKDCTVCGCPISLKDFNEYKMCPWCYAEQSFEILAGDV